MRRQTPLGGLFESEPFCVVLDAVGNRYGKRPSDLWGITDPEHLMLGIAFDAEVLRKANEFEKLKYEEAKTEKVGLIPEDERKRASLLQWKAVMDTAPEGSVLRQQAEKVVQRLMGEVG